MNSQRSMLLDVNREPTDDELNDLMHEVGESVRAASKKSAERYQQMLAELITQGMGKLSAHES